MADTAIFDVDGTLVDPNYQHALAWFRAFRRVGHHPADLAAAPGHRHGRRHARRARRRVLGGVALRKRPAGSVEAGNGADDRRNPAFRRRPGIAAEVKRRGFALVMASSGSEEQVDTILDLFGAKEFADAWTTSADAKQSKPPRTSSRSRCPGSAAAAE